MPVFYSPVPEKLQVGLAYVGGSVFSNNRTADSDFSREQEDASVVNELVSHLPLQMLLYFNIFYFPCWWFSAVFMLEVKFHYLPGYYQALLITGMILLTIIEVVRLYLGYVGNLREKVIPTNIPSWTCLLDAAAEEAAASTAGAAVLPDRRGNPHPAPGESRPLPVPRLPAGPDPGLLPGAEDHDPKAHLALPPAAVRQGGEPRPRGDEPRLRVALPPPPRRAARVPHPPRAPLKEKDVFN
uniref:Zgc:112294 n=1 Tax=Gasterosteus aculeatus aculeatus TaxID=481459 RepID=A0AAQ4RIF8_GASAC